MKIARGKESCIRPINLQLDEHNSGTRAYCISVLLQRLEFIVGWRVHTQGQSSCQIPCPLPSYIPHSYTREPVLPHHPIPLKPRAFLVNIVATFSVSTQAAIFSSGVERREVSVMVTGMRFGYLIIMVCLKWW